MLGKALMGAQVPQLWAFSQYQDDPVPMLGHDITKSNQQSPTLTLQ
jgi:hypothetical protein